MKMMDGSSQPRWPERTVELIRHEDVPALLHRLAASPLAAYGSWQNSSLQTLTLLRDTLDRMEADVELAERLEAEG